MKAKKKKAKKRAKLKTLSVNITLSAEHRAYVAEIASYACVSFEQVCAVLMATGIFQARRQKVPALANSEREALCKQAADALADNMRLEGLLKSCRTIMEANDPGNARTIFGPPVEAPPETPTP